ncbi:MAG: hypothetical protein AAF570_05980 [Bacteroidota bacterium]
MPKNIIRTARKRIVGTAAFLFLCVTVLAQSNLTPYKITIFKDAAQIGSKGIVRFHQQKAEVPMELEVDMATADLVTGSDFDIAWFKIREDSVVEKSMVRDWSEILKANISRRVTIVFEVGAEFDEVSGDIRLINEKDGILLLHGTDDSEYFIPLSQIRQVVVDTLSEYKIEHKVPRKLLEIGINKDVPFVPMELFSLHQGLSWEPICRIRIKGSDKAALQMLAMIENNVVDFTDVEVELSSSSILEQGQMNDEVLEVGKISMKKGDRVVMNFRETELDYKALYKCDVPWNGMQADGNSRRYPVENTMEFEVPVLSTFSCDLHAVIDENNRNIANLSLSEPGVDGKVNLTLGTEKLVHVNVVEEKKKSSKKPVTIGDEQFLKVNVEGKIICYNVGGKFIRLELSREILGDILDAGKGQTKKSEKGARLKRLWWRINLDKGQKKEVVYKYDALVPYVKE